MTESTSEHGHESSGDALPERTGPRGPVSWLRRRGLPWVGRLSALLGLALLVAWGTGRVLTDEHRWSQYLYWVPTAWVVTGVLGLCALSWISGRLATRLSGDILRPVVTLGALGALGWMGLVEWRGTNLVRASVDPGRPSLRVVFWNNSSKIRLTGADEGLAALGAGLLIVTNPTTGEADRAGLLEVLAETGDGQAGGDTPVHVLDRWEVCVGSRLPIVGYGEVLMARSEGADETWRTGSFGGRAMFLELDASEEFPGLGRPLVVWMFDLPSDPGLHKMEPARIARTVTERFTGPVYRPDASGGVVASTDTVDGFPPPDVVVGDFNTPRGSASVRTIVGNMESAHAQGGFGPDYTWEQPWAWWAIDLMFVGQGWRARRFDAVGLEGHAHAAIVGDIVRE